MTKLASIFPNSQSGYWGTSPGTADVDVRAIRNGDVGTTGELAWANLPLRGFKKREVDRALVRKGDSVLTTSGNCGNVAYVSAEPRTPTAATNFVRILRVDVSVADARYAFHFLRTAEFHDAIAPFVRGATIKNLSAAAAFDVVDMPTPPLAEQRRIALVLDRADALRAKRRQVLAYLDTLTQAIFRDMFAGRVEAARRLDSLLDADDRMNYGVVQPGDDLPGGVPLIRISNLAKGVVDRSDLKQISPQIEAAYRRSRIIGTEILVSCVGSIGSISLVRKADIGSNIARAITRVPISDPITRTYVAAYLRTQSAQRYFASELRTVAQPTLNVGQLAATLVPVPPTDLQRRFADRLAQLDSARGAGERTIATTDELFAALQSRAFRGEL